MWSRQIKYQTRQEVDSSTFAGSYVALGSPLEDPACIVKIVNDSDVDVEITTDTSVDQDYIPAGSFALYDLTANSHSNESVFFPAGTQFYAKAAAGTGNVYLVSMYIKAS